MLSDLGFSAMLKKGEGLWNIRLRLWFLPLCCGEWFFWCRNFWKGRPLCWKNGYEQIHSVSRDIGSDYRNKIFYIKIKMGVGRLPYFFILKIARFLPENNLVRCKDFFTSINRWLRLPQNCSSNERSARRNGPSTSTSLSFRSASFSASFSSQSASHV